MTNMQVKILKSVYKKPKTVSKLYKKFHLDEETFKQHTLDDNFEMCIRFDSKDTYKDSILSLNNFGISYLEKRRNAQLKWLMPLVISIIALVKSFLPEIIALFALIFGSQEQ